MKREKLSSNEELISNNFIELCDQLHKLIKDHGHSAVPYRQPTVPIFSQKPSSEKQEILLALTKYIEIIEATVASGCNPNNNAEFLWRALSVFGIKCPSNFFSILESDDIIEIYSLDNIQIWRNLNFFDICTYTLESIFSEPWTDRYSRPDESTKECITAVTDCLSRGFETTRSEIPKHVVREVHSDELLDVEVNHNYLAPIKWQKSHEISGYIVVSKANVVKANRVKDQPDIEPIVLKQKPILTVVDCDYE